MDIVTENPDSNNLSYLQGSAVTIGALNTSRTIGYAGPLAVGDLTGDGRRDLLIGRLSGLVMLHESRGL